MSQRFYWGVETLKHIDWVSIDAGLEKYSKSTSNEVARILVEQGFSEVTVSNTYIVTAKKFISNAPA